MLNKEQLRKKYYKIRKNKYFEVKSNFFKPLIFLLNNLFSTRSIYLSSYFPSIYEVNTVKFFEIATLLLTVRSFDTIKSLFIVVTFWLYSFAS